ncbi:MAG: NADH-quinone oxidoreductase subunit N [Candidatus Omnitrophica bacterium]|nr:NADH-quinone oxidoreductase subunit N [Candidatus Omnitrophota bacterium]
MVAVTTFTADWSYLLPEIVLTAGGLLLLLLYPVRSPRLLSWLTLFFLAAAFDLKLVNLIDHPTQHALFYGTYLWDRFGAFFQLLILLSTALVLLCAAGFSKGAFRERRELYALLLFAAAGSMVLTGAQHLALVYVGLELLSILSYALVGFFKKESLSIEGGLKYFLFGSLATGMMLYGISLIYGLTGMMDISFLSMAFPKVMQEAPFLSGVAILLLVAGLAFKVALVPFHMWAPDAYEGAATPVTAFLSVVPKLAGFAVLARVFLTGFSPAVPVWTGILWWVSVVTMTVGNVAALTQSNLKRLLAYSSIAHAGTMAVGLAVATPLGLSAMMYYGLAYLLMNLCVFAGVIAVENAEGRQDLGAFAGLSRREPFLAFAMAMALLSLAGIPPLAGFFAKLWIFGAALKANQAPLALVAAANSVISVFYYAKVIKAMYLESSPAAGGRLPRSRALALTVGFSAAALLVAGLLPGPWLSLAADSLPLPLKAGDLPWIP